MTQRQKIMPCLWFDHVAEAAVAHYLAIFPSGRVTSLTRYGGGQPGPAGGVMTIAFELEGQAFLALNGGPNFSFTPAISLIVNCDDQDEIDLYWERLSEGGAKGRCGWLEDRFGLSWQIVPRGLSDLLTSGDAEKVQRVMKLVMSMDKLDLKALQQA